MAECYFSSHKSKNEKAPWLEGSISRNIGNNIKGTVKIFVFA